MAPRKVPYEKPRYVSRSSNARSWRGLETLAIYLQARRELLFERFLEMWTHLERDGFRARLTFAAGERVGPSQPVTARSQNGNAPSSRAAVESRAASR